MLRDCTSCPGRQVGDGRHYAVDRRAVEYICGRDSWPFDDSHEVPRL